MSCVTLHSSSESEDAPRRAAHDQRDGVRLLCSALRYVVAVGGVNWVDDDMTRPVAWYNQSGCSGGGFSWEWDAPPYQAEGVKAYLASQPAPGVSFNSKGRAYPDISARHHPPRPRPALQPSVARY